MKIEGSFLGLKGSAEFIYQFMTDPKILRRCMPGCKELSEIEPDKYKCDLDWGYKGTIRAERTPALHKVKLVVEGKGPAGSVRASGVVQLESQGENGILAIYSGDLHLGGPAAILQMGSSLFGGKQHKKLIESFFENLKTQLAALSAG